MDQKTFEYMNERAGKYRSLKVQKTNLTSTLTHVKSGFDINFYINGNHVSCTSQMSQSQSVDFKSKLSALIENVIADIDKEMGEI